MKTKVKKAMPKKAVKKVAVRASRQKEVKRVGLIKVDVKVYEKTKEVTVHIDGLTADEVFEICLDIMERASNESDSKKRKKPTVKKPTVKKSK
jgi:hypothetical protein